MNKGSGNHLRSKPSRGDYLIPYISGKLNTFKMWPFTVF